MRAIATLGLTKVYRRVGRPPRRALDGLDLEVAPGECFGFLGRNGAGKSTTIKLLCSLIAPSAGEAFLFDENVRTRSARRLLGYLPEQPYFYEYLTPRETVDFYGRVRGLSAAARAKEWDRLAPLLELGGIADERIKGFSKGMRQRVGFAIALLGDPPLALLDEPMSGLDPVGRRSIRGLMQRLKAEGKTVFFSSHVLGDVEQVCDRVGMLVQGRLTRQGTLGELLARAVLGVEVAAEGIGAAAAQRIAADAVQYAAEGGLHRFRFADAAAANAAVRAVHAAGGGIAEYAEVRETLEDYFLREQAAHAGEGAARGIA